ncbi:hypothetical protein PPYR_08023 [Photinus pyralis]|nr:hypothetical protein PPYR_08023 [Photinus pyralis]
MLQVQKNIKGWGQVECYKMNKMMLAVIIIFYSFLFALYIGTMLARIIVKDPNKWIMPIIEFSLFDTTYSPNFEIAWFYHTVATLGCSSIYCFADFLIAGLIIDLTTQYTVLTETIKIQFKSTCSEKNKEPSYEDLKAFIGSVVSHHTSLIQLTTEVNSACADLLLITVMASLVTVSSAMYYATVVPMQSTAAVLSIFEMLAVITSMFVLSYFGTQLSTASQNVANACYELDFIGLDVRFQKSLLMIIMRCQRPAWLSVGGFTNLSIAVFTWMMRSTYSYFMILRKNQQVKDGTMQST